MAIGENFIRICNQRNHREEEIISKLRWFRTKLQEMMDDGEYDNYYELKEKFESYKMYAYRYWHYQCKGNYDILHQYEKKYLW